MTELSPRSGAETAIHSDALRLAPNSPDVLTTRGLVLFLTGKLPQALQHVQSALRLDPGHEPAMQLRKRVKEVERVKEEGNKSFKSGDLSDAIEKYTDAIQVNHFSYQVRDHGDANRIPIVASREQGRGSKGWPDTCDAVVKQGDHVSEGVWIPLMRLGFTRTQPRLPLVEQTRRGADGHRRIDHPQPWELQSFADEGTDPSAPRELGGFRRRLQSRVGEGQV